MTPGDRLGSYEILAKLGEGGMGEVYRAKDTKLNRDVAIKVLPASVAQDPERLARFKREAQVLASLNHPNIAAIYGLDEAHEKLFLVLELVGGEDLSERLKRGSIPVDEALEIARQIALARALESGKLRRDYHHSLYAIACLRAAQGDAKAAVDLLRRAVETGMPNRTLFLADPLLASVRGTPEFAAFDAELEPVFRRYEQEVGSR